MNKKAQQQYLDLLIKIFIILVVFLALFFGGKGIELVTELFSKILISLVFSMVAGALVGLIPADFLEFGNANIGGFRFNWVAAIITFIVKQWLLN